ncbi:enoyl-CoA hydratase-related protein [Nocardia sp. BMG51109]|uniref:enoyl-CoA hydratase-related protein n=1 Tax=Nocardia sp. BMG51109 TaxID=1056816 RepID=UPI003510B513
MSFVLVEKPRPQVALVTLNRSERMNAMAFDVMVPLREALESVAADNDVRAVVLTGAGDGFCSGADLQGAGKVPNIGGLTKTSIARRSMDLLNDVMIALRRMHQPVIAAINGAAIGGGFCLGVGADIRIAAEGAYFRAAGINNGLTSTELGMSGQARRRQRSVTTEGPAHAQKGCARGGTGARRSSRTERRRLDTPGTARRERGEKLSPNRLRRSGAEQGGGQPGHRECALPGPGAARREVVVDGAFGILRDCGGTELGQPVPAQPA